MRTRVLLAGGVILAPVLAGLYFLQLHNYLLFHVLTELFSIVVAIAMFIVAWNARRYQHDGYLTFLGISFLFVGVLDLFHTLTYKGMAVLPGRDTNIPTQLWLAARYTQAAALLAAPAFIGRSAKTSLLFIGSAAVSVLLIVSIFAGAFPAAYIEGFGLTHFKLLSEYVICLLLIAAMTYLHSKRAELNRRVYFMLCAAMAVTIAQELTFTLYTDPYGAWNFTGHCLKILAFCLVYKAIVETGLAQPYELLFRSLKRSEERYRDLVELSPDAVFVNRNGKIAFVNPAAVKLFGASTAEDLLGKPPFDFFHPDYHPIIEARIKTLLSGSRVPLIRSKVVRVDGSVCDVEVTAAPFTDEEGQAIQVVLRDATERQRTEEALKEADRKKDEFLAVLAHELRNPLAAISSAAAVLASPHIGEERIKYAKDVLKQRVVQVSRLIDDLLDVSRITQGKTELCKSRLDISSVVAGAVEATKKGI